MKENIIHTINSNRTYKMVVEVDAMIVMMRLDAVSLSMHAVHT